MSNLLKLVQELRDRTGAGMMDCKKALEACDSDIEKAIDWLREKGIAKSIKKASRIAAEGLSKIKIDGNKLYQAMKERGLTPTKICREIGVNGGYFANAKSRGSIANMMIVLLESRYGIPRDTYVVKEEEEVSIVEVVQHDDFFSEENQQKLYKLVYSAVYNAMKRALSE